MYTLSRRFAVTVDPGNEALAQRKREIDAARAEGRPTVPSLLGLELDTNPFLRPRDQGIRRQLGLGPEAEDWQVGASGRLAVRPALLPSHRSGVSISNCTMTAQHFVTSSCCACMCMHMDSPGSALLPHQEQLHRCIGWPTR